MYRNEKIKFILKYGIRGVIQRNNSYLYQISEDEYNKWYQKNKIGSDEIEQQKEHEFKYSPKISIIVPVYNTPMKYLKDMLDSVCNQTYENWELCIANASPNILLNRKVIQEYQKRTNKIKVIDVPENLGIAQNTNKALEIVSGDYVGLLDHDDILAFNCLYEVVKKINCTKDVEVIYTDEDKFISTSDKHVEPNFKPNYNIDLLRSNNYICHFFVAKKSLIDQVGGFRQEYDGAQDYDMILRCCEKAKKISHISKILYHWRIHADSTAENPESKNYAYESGKKAILAHLARMNEKGKIYNTENLGFYRVEYSMRKDKIAVVIINRDNAKILKRCLKNVLNTKYQNIQIYVLDISSYDAEIKKVCDNLQKYKVQYWKCNREMFHNELCRTILHITQETYIMTILSYVFIDKKNCIEILMGNCQRRDVAAVGGKIIKKDRTIYYAGAYIYNDGEVQNLFENMPETCVGYMHRDNIQQDFNNLSVDMMMIKRNALMRYAKSDIKEREKKEELFVYTPYAKGYLSKKCKSEKLKRKFLIKSYDIQEDVILEEGYKLKI